MLSFWYIGFWSRVDSEIFIPSAVIAKVNSVNVAAKMKHSQCVPLKALNVSLEEFFKGSNKTPVCS
jgi:hypothetical protein